MRRILIVALVMITSCDGSTDPDGDAGQDSGGSCESPLLSCPGSGCVNTANDTDNCGECGNTCSGCDRCIMGSCTLACCGNEVDCDPSPSGLDCIDAEDNRTHCGYCDNSCTDNEICYNTSCVACEAPDVRCGNRCVDLSRDIENCGECDLVCQRMYCQCGECVPERSDGGC